MPDPDSRAAKDTAASGRGWKERLTKAHVFLATARTCLEQQDWDTATSRAYYAAFHAATAFLEQHPARPMKASDKGGTRKRYGPVCRGTFVHYRSKAGKECTSYSRTCSVNG